MKHIKRFEFIIILCLPLLISAQTSPLGKGIIWTDVFSWEQVLQKAKQENKFIFVDCYATWCGPCKWMDENVYQDDTIGKYFNDKFISIKLQMDTSKLDDERIKGWYADARIIKNKYQVNAFPTYLFFSPNGKIVHRDEGVRALEGFIAVGAEALNPDVQYYITIEKFYRNELDTAYMKKLARKAKGLKEDKLAHDIANEYISRLSTEALFTKDNILFMCEFTKSSKNRGFTIFKDSSKKISEIDERVNQSRCKNIVTGIINNEEIRPYSLVKNGKPDWGRIKSNLKKYGPLGEEALRMYKPGIIFKTEIEPVLKINSDWNKILPLIKKQELDGNYEFVVGSTVVYYLNAVGFYHTEKNCKNLVAAATFYANSYSTLLGPQALNTWAWTVFENSSDRNELKKALEWSKRSNELGPGSPEYLDTYANLLYKLGYVKEAIDWQKKAVRTEEGIAKRPIFQQTLVKMQKGEKTWPEK
jgi:thioredoxin-related protein